MSNIFVSILVILLAITWIPLTFAVVYLLLLTVAAALPHPTPPHAQHERTFRIVIPAHNEELVLGPVLRHLMHMRYPRTKFDVVVVADNCSDQTAEVARAYGARVLERYNLADRGKGHALAHAFAALQNEPFDAYVVLDADTLVDPELLAVFNRYLTAGHRIIQAYYDVLNPFESHQTALMYIALRILHYVRPLGRRALGLSATLTGNGMCFTKAVIDRYHWNAFSLTEDLEYTSLLIRNGERIIFAPEAQVCAQMPVARAQATTQRMRWEAGHLQVACRDGLRLLMQGLWRLDLRVFDCAMDLVTPPLAVLTLVVTSGTAIATAMAMYEATTATTGILWAWLALSAALVFFVVAAMIIGRLPKQAYGAMLSAPSYVLWKLWIYMVILTHRAPQNWVRTDRTRIQDQ